MSSSNLEPGSVDEANILRGRLADIFSSRPFADTGSSSRAEQHTQGLGITSEPTVRTRLLESYDESNPVCGERRCSHGTFSPHIETAERQTYLGFETSNNQHGSHEAANASAASGFFLGGDGHPGSDPGSEHLSQMKTSLSALSMNESKKL